MSSNVEEGGPIVLEAETEDMGEYYMPKPAEGEERSENEKIDERDNTEQENFSTPALPHQEEKGVEEGKPSPRHIRKNALMERSLKYRRVLEEDDLIDMDIVRALAFQGVPDMEGLRSIYWKLLLGYLPPDKRRWPDSLKQSRHVHSPASTDLYDTWKEELILDPSKFTKHPKKDDHPLSTEDTSSWNRFFKDNELDIELEKDVRRTFPHYHFFNGEAERKKHYQAIKRILFIYAKLNPGIGYVQGMNEILGPLYYIMTSDCDPEWKEFAEPDAFFCFTNLMSEIRDNFCKTLDKSEMGVRGAMGRLNGLLQRKHLELWQNLEDKQMDPQFYSFRWLTLLLSQEFELPDIFRLWDSFFSDLDRFEFMTYFCCAIAVADDLLRGGFADNLKLLQHYPTTIDIGMLLNIAMDLRDADILIDRRSTQPPPATPVPLQPQPPAPTVLGISPRLGIRARRNTDSGPAPTPQPQPSAAAAGDTAASNGGAIGSGIMGGVTRTWSRLASGFPYMGVRGNSQEKGGLGGGGEEAS